MKSWHSHSTDRLMRVFSELSTPEECYRFMEDLCTIREIIDMAQRLDVAIMLKEKIGYQEINQKTGVSTATISRVSKCLSYGTGGYDLAVDTIQKSDNP